MIKQTRVNQFLNPIKGSNAKTLSIELEEMEKMRLTETKFFPNETSVRIKNYPTEK